MKEEFLDVFWGVIEYFEKLIVYVKPLWVFISTGFCYIVFPDDAYIPPAIGLSIALVFDVITKYYAIAVKNGGFFNAIKTRKISSETMWKGTKKKIISILMVMIVCGLSIRFTPFLPQIAIGISTVAYGFMFYREVQSIFENLLDAGHEDVKWFLSLIKKKKKEIVESEGIELEDEQQ